MVSDRARQFMPFSVLKGFHEMLREKERAITAKKVLSEDDSKELSDKIVIIRKGMLIKVVYYYDGQYIQAEGMVANVDFIFRTLTVVKTKIKFDDIVEISF